MNRRTFIRLSLAAGVVLLVRTALKSRVKLSGGDSKACGIGVSPVFRG